MPTGRSKRLDPRTIRFTRDSVYDTFEDKRHLEDTLKDLKDGKYDVETIPRITVVPKDGVYFSLNNKRLWVFKEYAKFVENTKNEVLQVPVKFGTLKMLISSGMTTTNEGEKVMVRAKGSEEYHTSIETVRLSDVVYSTDKLYRFSKYDGGHYERSTIYDEFERFSSNIHETKQLPTLKVVKRKGQLYALDNLQLWLLKQWYQRNGQAIEDETLSKDASTDNKTASNGIGDENQNDRTSVEGTVNNLDASPENECPTSRKSVKMIETVIYQRNVSDGSQSVGGETNESDSYNQLQKRQLKELRTLDLDLKGRHEEQNDEHLTKSHIIETNHIKYNDVINGGENVLVELRPYRELTENLTTTNEGRSIEIVWNEPKPFEWRKFKPLTRQRASQERKELMKYCKCYENQSKKSSRR
ncbi:uncharacterized protein LOC123558771 [Mercenaria mercenaria]|uniref:uncharacterized protein LOC123558771 n=1 Tax=Mercenaria mercenaria TaxID=6596 RepID=UPI00234E9D8B|nr:uncharacterized protein LOC123558771 [Mercenaria mercenaria]